MVGVVSRMSRLIGQRSHTGSVRSAVNDVLNLDTSGARRQHGVGRRISPPAPLLLRTGSASGGRFRRSAGFLGEVTILGAIADLGSFPAIPSEVREPGLQPVHRELHDLREIALAQRTEDVQPRHENRHRASAEPADQPASGISTAVFHRHGSGSITASAAASRPARSEDSVRRSDARRRGAPRHS